MEYLKGKTSLSIIQGIGITPTFCQNTKKTKTSIGSQVATCGVMFGVIR